MDNRQQLLSRKQRITPRFINRMNIIGRLNRKRLQKTRRVCTVKSITAGHMTNLIEQGVQQRVPRVLNPVLYFSICDRLLILEGDKITLRVIFNNDLTKRLTTTKFNKKSGLLRVYWEELQSKELIHHPMYLIKRLEQSNNKELYKLSTLIKNQ